MLCGIDPDLRHDTLTQDDVPDLDRLTGGDQAILAQKLDIDEELGILGQRLTCDDPAGLSRPV